jgi:hypothetical protein
MTEMPFDIAELEGDKLWFFVPFVRLALAAPSSLGPLRLTRLNRKSWHSIEREELVKEHLNPMVDPPTVVGILAAELDRAEDEQWVQAQVIRDAAAGALRLAGDFDFIEPELVALYSKLGPRKRRIPGHYRQAMLSRLFKPTEQLLQPAIITDADRLYSLVLQIEVGASRAKRLPLDLFRLSFGPFLGNGERLLFLFASLEALLLPWREEVDGVRLEARATVAAALGGSSVPAELTTGVARKARNQLAHGEPDPTIFDSLIRPIQEMMRGALRCWLEFHNALPKIEEPFREFNRRLAIAVKSGETGDDVAQRIYGRAA